MSHDIEALRDAIEAVSHELLDVLARRTTLAVELAGLKRQLGMPLRDAMREAELLDHLAAHAPSPLDEDFVRTVLRAVFDASVAAMERGGERPLRVGPRAGPPVEVAVGEVVLRGGPAATLATRCWIAGPCSVESEEQLERAASGLAALGVRILRGGTFKPRTSPYAFQGLGIEGVEILARVAHRHGMAAVTEVLTPEQVEQAAPYVDMLQIGARNMHNAPLLRAVARSGRPVLLKRGFGATVEEWIYAAEYVALAGCEAVVLCERGIRTFEPATRATLDVAAVPLARALTRLPVVVDVSHAAGRRDLLAPLAAAALGAGAGGVMVEVHPDPDCALSDAHQQITVEQFARLQRDVAAALSRAAGAVAQVPRARPTRAALAQPSCAAT